MQETPSPPGPASPRPNLLILPLALAGGLIFVNLGGNSLYLAWLCQLVFHELGHALIFWARSILAIPSFGVTMPLHSGSSIFIFFTLVALALWGIRSSKRAGYRFISSSLIAFLILLVLFSLLTPNRTGEIITLYGGLGGELYLATFAMLAFYQPMPKRFEWHRNRYLFLVMGSASFCGAARLWYRAQRDRAKLPMGGLFDFGGAFSDNGESGGDLDRLMREFGWTADTVVSAYVITTLVCVAVLIGYYLYLWYRELHLSTEAERS